MSTHASLTEPSLRAHPRKGREGKGREQGREVGVADHHIVALRNARDRDAMVKALTRPEVIAA